MGGFARFRLGVAWTLQDGYSVLIAMGFPVKYTVPGREHGRERPLRGMRPRAPRPGDQGGKRREVAYRKRYRESVPSFSVHGSYDSIDIDILHHPYHFAIAAFCLGKTGKEPRPSTLLEIRSTP
jgi:hypothetical protein